MKKISVRESYDFIEITEEVRENAINKKELMLLEKYIKKNRLNEKYISWENGKFRFINYVGFINIGSLYIEILPKTQKNSVRNERKALINMLKETNTIEIKYSELSTFDFEKENLMEIFAYLFSEKLKEQLLKGIYKEYINVNENLSVLKGKLQLKFQINNNVKNNLKANCEYDFFSENSLLNRIFKSGSLYLQRKVKTLKTLENLKIINMILINVDRINVEKYYIDKIVFNRNNARFSESFILLKKLFYANATIGKQGKDNGFSILFEMQDLFEKYVGKVLQLVQKNKKIKLQDTSRKLLINTLTDKGIFQLKPDIVMDDIIIDTKWKILKNINRHGILREDLYQMYAYLTRYKEVKRVILIYPLIDANYKNGEILEKWCLEEYKEKTIEVAVIDYTNNIVAKEGILNIIK